ncbi:Tandem pore domain K channel [Ceraceosorus bombacis]|uniref:Tandem pore domain K channel n=1 Tax=Ceraceosorus bombacis TaxID=401625 RepID=A0A0P1BMD9_9BASI|nr:Tandem pore domain K channel [Ceraceosorus bombacis]
MKGDRGEAVSRRSSVTSSRLRRRGSHPDSSSSSPARRNDKPRKTGDMEGQQEADGESDESNEDRLSFEESVDEDAMPVQGQPSSKEQSAAPLNPEESAHTTHVFGQSIRKRRGHVPAPVVVKDFAKPTLALQSPSSGGKPSTGVPMARTVSFRPDEPNARRLARPEQSTAIWPDQASGSTRQTEDGDDWDASSIMTATTATDADTEGTSGAGRDYRGRFAPLRVLRRHRAKEEAEAEAELSSDEEMEKEARQVRIYRRTPVVSGTIAPFSIMLEIPGITSRWYVRTGPDNRPIAYRNNPIILDVGLAISLACAVVANFCIIARFTERLSPRTSTLIAILGFCLHDIVNCVALIIFGVVHAVDDGFTYSESYWMTAAATAVSMLCTVSLIWDFASTKRFQHAGSGLTPKQTKLVLVIMSFLVYLSLSALIFALLHSPSLNFLDSVYFTIVTFLSIGFGDIAPNDVAMRILFLFLMPPGIVLLGLVIATARESILEEFELSYKKRRALFRQRLKERSEARRHNRRLTRAVRNSFGRGGAAVAGSASKANNGADALHPEDASLKHLRNGVAELTTAQSLGPTGTHEYLDFSPGAEDPERSPTQIARIRDVSEWLRGGGGSPHRSFSIGAKRGQVGSKLEAAKHDAIRASPPAGVTPLQGIETREESSPTVPVACGASTDVRPADGDDGGVVTAEPSPSPVPALSSLAQEMAQMEAALTTQRQVLDKSWKSFRQQLDASEQRQFWLKLAGSFLLFLAFWLVGAAVFSATEGFTFFQALYFALVAASTVGYGDFSVSTPAGKAFFICWSLLGVGVLSILFAVMSDAWASMAAKNSGKRKTRRAGARISAAIRSSLHLRGRKPTDANEACAEGETATRGVGDVKTAVPGSPSAAAAENDAQEVTLEKKMSIDESAYKNPADNATATESVGMEALTPVATRTTLNSDLVQASPSRYRGGGFLRRALTRDSTWRMESPRRSVSLLPTQSAAFLGSAEGVDSGDGDAAPRETIGDSNSLEPKAMAASLAPHELPVHFARHALSFHKHGFAMMHTQRAQIAHAIRHLPAMARVEHRLRRQRTLDPRHTTKISKADEQEILQAAQESSEPGLEIAVRQWIEMMSIEDLLHQIFAVSSTMSESLAEMDSLRAEVAQLKAAKADDLEGSKRMPESARESTLPQQLASSDAPPASLPDPSSITYGGHRSDSPEHYDMRRSDSPISM